MPQKVSGRKRYLKHLTKLLQQELHVWLQWQPPVLILCTSEAPVTEICQKTHHTIRYKIPTERSAIWVARGYFSTAKFLTDNR